MILQQVTDTPWKCTHNMQELPHWKSKDKLEQFSFLWEDDRATELKENYAFTIQQTNFGFKPRDIEELRRRHLFDDSKLRPRPRYMMLTADAAGGGKSEFAIACGYFTPDERLIVSAFIFFLFYFFFPYHLSHQKTIAYLSSACGSFSSSSLASLCGLALPSDIVVLVGVTVPDASSPKASESMPLSAPLAL